MSSEADAWAREAEAAIADVRAHVRAAAVSPALRGDAARVYINLTTLEDRHYCIEMTASGFRVVGRKYDDTSLSTIENMNYETPYALLDSVSEAYRSSFGGELMSKLVLLENERREQEMRERQEQK